MAKTITCTADLTRLTNKIAKWTAVMHEDSGRALDKAALMLAHKLVEVTPPRGGQDKIKKDVRKNLGSVFSYQWGSGDGVLYGQKRGSKGITWRQASPKRIEGWPENMALGNQSKTQMARRIRDEKGKLGKKWNKVGQRGKQGVYIASRYLIAKHDYDSFAKIMESRIGRMKAGWLQGVDLLKGALGSVPQWVKRHRNRPGSAEKNVGADKKTITFRNWAPGIARPAIVPLFKAAARKVMYDLELEIRKHALSQKNWANL